MFFTIYQHIRHFNLEALLMPKTFNGFDKYHLIENYFQLYTNLVDQLT